ncbi:TrkH family potassium uptake protein [Blastopirellula sp. J2-11]|uniref:TrkH family potassium uptake protein n=1 Tax=Blastopirellula sp. J2-11 TaxID=2943192 RepID=UPI0021C80A76|nr:TrkH family potassium uptake protein [Blastopirellula sp. J2-11]UUO07409.1 TrkH family potassium uptake protein [Blastopirellula sp. J2-11]
MNLPLLSKYLGVVTLLLAAAMLFALPWAIPWLGHGAHFDTRGFFAILSSAAIAATLGGGMLLAGRNAHGPLYRREAIAIVGISWLIFTFVGALPFILGHVKGSESRERIVRLVVDDLFESASGFTGAGATIMNDIEDESMLPKCLLFWRSETHFVGGLGIMVLFVALLGQGSAGKALLMTESVGPQGEVGTTRSQHSAWIFAGIYVGLNIILTLLLMIEGMNLFDALCHSFGTIATGGLSTYNASVAHFENIAIEMTIGTFMMIACVNFSLLYAVLLGQWTRLWINTELWAYLAILFGVIGAVMIAGLWHHDFPNVGTAFRYSYFNVISVQTNTGFGTNDFDHWNEFSRGMLFVIMFVGGCAGSTSCSLKVIRHVVLWKSLYIYILKTFRPRLITTMRLNGKAVEDSDELTNEVFIYFGMIGFVFITAWLMLLFLEPDQAWLEAGHSPPVKMLDCATGVAACINGVGPGLGALGPSKNFSGFSIGSKLVFTALMLLGRIEIFPLLVIFTPGLWRRPTT